MNVYKEIRSSIIKKLGELYEGQNLNFDAITAEPPREAAHGDVSTNAAMVLGKPLKKNPKELAAEIINKLKEIPEIKSAEIAGPGFINLKLNENVWQKLVLSVLKEGAEFGTSDVSKKEKVNIEYVSANPTGPMHIGHARNAVLGDALARLLAKAGFAVTKEYYINDAGAQVIKLADSVYLRYLEALGENIGAIPEGLYPGEYLIEVGAALKAKYGDKLKAMKEDERREIIREFSVNSMMTLIKKDLADIDIHHDVFSSEKALADKGAVQEAFNELDKKGLIYQGTLPPPKGKVIEDWEPKELTLFRSTQFGDESDRPMKKADGQWAYIAPDMAYHYDKIRRGFNKMILVLAVDHGGYQKRLQAAVSAFSEKKAELHVLLYQLVNLFENGEPFKMSKRAGNFITVRDVVDKVGKGVMRFIMLTRKHSEVLDFDFKKVTEQSKDNPVFYVQYANARANSVFKNAGQSFSKEKIKNISLKELSLIKDESELLLIRKIAEWPRVVESAAKSLEPHRVAFYLHDLASEFHSLWNKGKDDTALRFIIENNPGLTMARLAIIFALSITIESGLNVLGVEPVSEM